MVDTWARTMLSELLRSPGATTLKASMSARPHGVVETTGRSGSVPADSDPTLEEAALIALRSGDHEGALRELERLFGTALYRYARLMTGDDALAEDVWQTTFLQAYRDMGRFGGRSTLKTWLYTIARHRCLDALRVERRRRKRFVLTDVVPEVVDATSAPDERMSQQQSAAALEACLHTLSPVAREAVLLRYREGFSYRDMEKLCEESSTTLRARVSRAMPVLRRCLQKKEI